MAVVHFYYITIFHVWLNCDLVFQRTIELFLGFAAIMNNASMNTLGHVFWDTYAEIWRTAQTRDMGMFNETGR